ncbi:MAG: carbonic anhydrase [Balneolaceae bacterium]|nr:carbonic anhydrase [Balneolaceae bacterium]
MIIALITGLVISSSLFGIMQISSDSDSENDDDLLTDEIRANMKPAEILQAFKDGNQRFTEGNLRRRKFVKEVSATSEKQTPYAIVHSCIDSRVPVETIFDARIGEIFSTRLAGNVINSDVLGGMEFATSLSGAKLILVMGHTRCGAVKGAADSAEFGHLTALVNKIKVAEGEAKSSFNGDADPNNYAYVDHLAKEYVKLAINQIRKESPVLKELEEKEAILIAGGMYNIGTGKVDFFEV